MTAQMLYKNKPTMENPAILKFIPYLAEINPTPAFDTLRF